jgi:hypothetical protein
MKAEMLCRGCIIIINTMVQTTTTKQNKTLYIQSRAEVQTRKDITYYSLYVIDCWHRMREWPRC